MADSSEMYREDIEQVRRRFAEYRAVHAVRSRLPEALWAAAAKLALRDGIQATARALDVDRPSLRKWTDRLEPNHSATVGKHHDLMAILSNVEEREVTNDYTIRHDNKVHQIVREEIRPRMRPSQLICWNILRPWFVSLQDFRHATWRALFWSGYSRRWARNLFPGAPKRNG